jgi:hypothetical protein
MCTVKLFRLVKLLSHLWHEYLERFAPPWSSDERVLLRDVDVVVVVELAAECFFLI